MNSDFTIAVHSLVLLAYFADQNLSSDRIAEHVSTHPARIRKVMSVLKKHRFVMTKEGVGGGYRLAAPPESIKLSDVYRSLCEGSIKPNWCADHPDLSCPVSANIGQVLDRLFFEAEERLVDFFADLTIRDVLNETQTLS